MQQQTLPPPRRTSPLLIPESPMQFLPSLAVVLDEASALFLQQLQYWVYHSRLVIDGKYWVYNTLDQWNLQFYFWSKSKLQRTIKHLQNYEVEGEIYHLILIENHNKNRANQTQYYTIDYDELDRLMPIVEQLAQKHKQEILQNSPSLKNLLKRDPDAIYRLHPDLYVPAQDSPVPDTETRFTHSQDDHVGWSKRPCEENQGFAGKNPQKSNAESLQVVKMTMPDSQNDHATWSKCSSPLINNRIINNRDKDDEEEETSTDFQEVCRLYTSCVQPLGTEQELMTLLAIFRRAGKDATMQGIETLAASCPNCTHPLSYLRTVIDNPKKKKEVHQDVTRRQRVSQGGPLPSEQAAQQASDDFWSKFSFSTAQHYSG